nr:head maturation protease, ClpP-related [uncultured Acetatifactor sp.]
MPKKINIKGPIVSNATAWLYNYFGWDASCPDTLRKGLEEAGGEDVIIEINSPGGVCVYGYEMYTALKEYEGRTTVHVISAMSAATLLVCAADEALISDTGIFMIHNVQSMAEGDYRDMQMEADALREFNAGIINAYVRKTGKSREEIQKLMDNDSYMSPKTAIEQGFIDGYMFGDPNVTGDDAGVLAEKIVAADVHIIPEDKAKTVMQAIRLSSAGIPNEEKQSAGSGGKDGEAAPAQQDGQNIGIMAVSDKPKEGGRTSMTFAEFLAENPDAKEEVDAMSAAARAEGIKAERERMQSLDAISATVASDALHDAKYGENPVDGPTLAYQALASGNKLAAAYMAAAQEDSGKSGVGDVGLGTPDAGEEQTDESDEMAAYVNKAKGGK